MKVKLTKEEFIKRSMRGEVFELNGYKYFYDEKEINPFRIERMGMNGSWGDFDGVNEFTVVEPKSKTKIMKEWMYSSNVIKNQWCLVSRLMTADEAMDYFEALKYKPTGREFEVPDE